MSSDSCAELIASENRRWQAAMAQDFAPSPGNGRFELTTFLEGKSRAWGIFEDRFGRMRRRFTVEMVGRWQGEVFLLEETFRYDDGEMDERLWRVVPDADGRFHATCDDCVGRAEGSCDADSIRMQYKFRLKFPGRDLIVRFDDRIYRMTESTAVNRATMSKWGIRLGELSLFFERMND